MRALYWLLGAAACVVVLILGAVPAEAHHTSDESGGCGFVVVGNAVAGAGNWRGWHLTTDTDTPSSLCGNAPVSEFEAGQEVTVLMNTQTNGLAPEDADTVTLSVVIDDEDDATDTLVTLHNGAPPADDSSFSFFLTKDGTATGAPAAGTLRFFLRVQFDGAVNADDYDCSSDGDASTGVSRDCDDFGGPFAGWIRSRMDPSSIAASSPPAGSIFAYGPGGDESVTATWVLPDPFKALGYQDFRIGAVRDSNGVVQESKVKDRSTGDQTEAFVIDNTFALEEASYGFRGTIEGLSPLSGEVWTKWVDTVSDGTRESDTEVLKSGLFTADPRVLFDTHNADGSATFAGADEGANTDHEVYNRGESVAYDFWLLNARSENLTRSMSIEVRCDEGFGGPTTVDTQSLTGPNYGSSYVIAAGDPATSEPVSGPGANQIGDCLFAALNTDQFRQTSNDEFAVSSFLFVDSHVQASDTLVKDDWPTENATETVQFVSGEDLVNVWCHVRGVRLDTEVDTDPGEVSIVIRDAAGDTAESGTRETGGDGWTTTVLQTAAVPPLGEWEAECDVSNDGNEGLTVQGFAVGSAFTGDKVIRLHVLAVAVDGSQTRVYALTEVNEQPVTPDSVPVLNITVIDHRKDPENFTAQVEGVSMVSAVTDKAEARGSLYYFNWTPVFDADAVFGNDGAVLANVQVSAVLNGTFIQSVEAAEIRTTDPGNELGGFSVLTAGFGGLSDEASFAIVFWLVVAGLGWAWNMNFLSFWASLAAVSELIPSDPLPFPTALILGLVIAWTYVVIRVGAEWRERLSRV